MASSLTYGPFVGTLNNRGRRIIRNPEETLMNVEKSPYGYWATKSYQVSTDESESAAEAKGTQGGGGGGIRV